MPELPEVQTVVNDLIAAGILHLPIVRAEVFWPKSIAMISPKNFCEKITGNKFISVSRRGKYILFSLSSADTLLVHLRMSGKLCLLPDGTPRSKHEHVILTFSNRRQLRFHDTRKFGRWFLTDAPQTILSRLGVEPLAPGFDVALLAKSIRTRHRMLKPLLLDQAVIAGLGNIYVDEALWEARLHPRRKASTLSMKEIRALHHSIAKVLEQGLVNMGTTLGDGEANFHSIEKRKGKNRNRLKVFGRKGRPCPRCRSPIERLIVGQRGTHICPTCQKGGA